MAATTAMTAALTAARSAASAARQPAAPASAAAGAVGDFDFLAGRWAIRHRKRKAGGVDAPWEEFEGEATCWTVLAGAGSIEELRIPARDFSGLGIRLLDPTTKLWADYWVGGKERVIGEPGLIGGFVDGVGTFAADDASGATPMKYRGVWDRITPRSHRWRSGTSSDGGKTWDDTWFMEWSRVG